MRFIACGTAAGPMSADRAASGYLLLHDGHTIMLDCGPGSLRQAMRCGVSPSTIEAVVLSHLHLDHALDMATYAYLLRYNPFWPVPDIYGPSGARDFIEQVATFGPPNDRPSPFASVVELEPGDRRQICGFDVASMETPHAPNLRAFARRIEGGGRSLVFSGDTTANFDGMTSLAQGADVLVHECFSIAGRDRYIAQRPPDQQTRILDVFSKTHCEVGDAARIARDAGVHRLVLTHLLATEDVDALYAAASAIFPGEVIVAADGLSLDV